MSYLEWRYWFKALPWSLKWFPILIIIRPIVDQFWHLKSISPFLSPLYWVGILTPVFCILGIRKFKPVSKTPSSKYFSYWTILVVINSILVLIVYPNLDYFALILKITIPVYLFFFLRVFIFSKQDLLGLLIAYMHSWGIVILLFVYELIFGARSIELTRVNLERWEGGFADVLNYAMYAISGFVIMVYFYFIRQKGNQFQRLLPALIALFLGALILARIYHTTSFITIIALIALTLFRIFKNKPSIGLLFIITISILYISFGEKIKKDSFDPLVDREIKAYNRGTNEYRLFNGRMGRWMYRWDEFNKGNNVGKVFGSGIGFFSSNSLIGISVHNDFFRIIFFTGFLGVIFYLLFYISLLTRKKTLDDGDRYLLEASVLVIFIYSLTTLPTMYPPFMYFLMSVFTYFSLPLDQLQNETINN